MSTYAPHAGSHRAALPEQDPPGVGRVDAVVVPSGRTAAHVAPAAGLAAELGAALVVLCSARSSAAAVADTVGTVPGLRWCAVDVDPNRQHRLLAPRPEVVGRGGRRALSLKRNAGLAIARMVGWDTVLFLDDDIRGVDGDEVRLAAGHLSGGGAGPASAVGLAVPDWPDNSVACHANRLGGGRQEVFVGGSALLVDPLADDLAHFPVVYNEDWLFLFDALAAGRVRRHGAVRQLPYDPFGDRSRAAAEEFGDVLAEGLVAHVEAGGTDVPLDAGYWSVFLRRRAAFLTDVTARLRAHRPGSPRHAAALRAVDTAAARCAELRPVHLLRFLRAWREDRGRWAELADRLPARDDVPDAVRELGLGRSLSPRPAGRAAPGPSAHPPAAVPIPAERPEGGALIVPGFLDGRASPAHRSLAAALPAIGLSSLTFDPRWTTDRADPLAGHPTGQLADIAALLDRLPSGGRRVLIGHCYGAWLAGLAAAARHRRVTELVAIMPTRCFFWPVDYDEDADRWRRRHSRVFTAPEPGAPGVRRSVQLPHTVVRDARGYDLPGALRELAIPVLFVAGAADEVVPAACVRDLYEGCGSPAKRYVELPGVGHDYRDHPDQLAAVQGAVLDWLRATPRCPAGR